MTPTMAGTAVATRVAAALASRFLQGDLAGVHLAQGVAEAPASSQPLVPVTAVDLVRYTCLEYVDATFVEECVETAEDNRFEDSCLTQPIAACLVSLGSVTVPHPTYPRHQ